MRGAPTYPYYTFEDAIELRAEDDDIRLRIMGAYCPRDVLLESGEVMSISAEMPIRTRSPLPDGGARVWYCENCHAELFRATSPAVPTDGIPCRRCAALAYLG